MGLTAVRGAGLRVIPSQSTHPYEATRHGRKVPTIFIDGSGWAFSFSLGVCKHLQDEYENTQDWEIFALSAGNIGGLLLALGMDIDTHTRLQVDKVREEVLYSHITQPLCMYCGSLGPVRYPPPFPPPTHTPHMFLPPPDKTHTNITFIDSPHSFSWVCSRARLFLKWFRV